MFLRRRSFSSSSSPINLTPANGIKLTMKEFIRPKHEEYREFIARVIAPKSYEPINPWTSYSGSDRYGFVSLKYENRILQHPEDFNFSWVHEIRCYDKKRGEVLFNTTAYSSRIISLLIENHPETGKDYAYLCDGFLPINLTDVEMGEKQISGRVYVDGLSPCGRWGYGMIDGSGGWRDNFVVDLKDPMNPKHYKLCTVSVSYDDYVRWHSVEGQEPVLELKACMEEQCEADCDVPHTHITKEMIGYTNADGQFVLFPAHARTHSLFIRPSSVIEGRY